MRETNKVLPELIDGQYIYTLSSYEPATITVIKPKLDYAKAAKVANDMIAQRGGSSESIAFWYMEEFGVGSREALFQKVVELQKEQHLAYIEQQIQEKLADALAQRVEQTVPDKVLNEVAQEFFAYHVAQIKETTNVDMEHPASQEEENLRQAHLDIAKDEALLNILRTEALQAYARHNNIQVSQEDIDLFYSSDEFKDFHNLDEAQVVAGIQRNRALELFRAQATINTEEK